MFKDVIREIEKANKIYITGHINPDGDSIGSVFGLYFALKKIGKDVLPILSNYSSFFSFMPNINDGVSKVVEDEYDLLICVDSSSKSRLAICDEDFNKAKKVVMIDHHEKDMPYGKVNVIDSSLPAASELIYNLIKEMNIELDELVASYIYMGIMTDTGSFNYSSTKPSTMRAAADLISVGIDFSEICKKINDTIKESKLFLIEKAISNMEVFYGGKVRYTFVDYDTISSLGVDEEDAEGMTNYLRKVENTEVAIYVRGKQNGELKVSMRSNGKVDIAKIAISFGGGGHVRASGYTMNLENSTYEKEKQKLIDLIGVNLNDDFSG